jgi:hypothetical protein
MTFGLVIDEIDMGYQPSSWLALPLPNSFHSQRGVHQPSRDMSCFFSF